MCSGTWSCAVGQSGLVNPEDIDITIFRNVENSRPAKERHISEDVNLRQHHCNSLFMHGCVDRITSY